MHILNNLNKYQIQWLSRILKITVSKFSAIHSLTDNKWAYYVFRLLQLK